MIKKDLGKLQGLSKLLIRIFSLNIWINLQHYVKRLRAVRHQLLMVVYRETTARYSLSSFIAVNIAKLKNEIKKRDIKKFSSPESNMF